jgi:magnesium transporter
MSVRNAAALAVAQLGIAAFFISGVTVSELGPSAAWLVIVAASLAVFARALDIESWALLVPGGLVTRVHRAFGARASRVALAATLVERLLLAALACVVLGHYAAGVAVTSIVGGRITGFVTPEDFATILAVAAVGVLWGRARTGRNISREAIAGAVWTAVGIVALVTLWSIITFAIRGPVAIAPVELNVPPEAINPPGLTVSSDPAASLLGIILACAIGIALTLPVLGSGEVLAHAANEFPPPRIQAIRRTAFVTVVFTLAITVVGTLLYLFVVPPGEQVLWADVPIAGLAQNLSGPYWLRGFMTLLATIAAVVILMAAAHPALTDLEQVLLRSSADGILPTRLSTVHVRFGTHARAFDVAAAAIFGVILVSGGRTAWLSRAYAIAIVVIVALTVAALAAYRRTRSKTIPFKVPGTLRLHGHEIPVGLFLPAGIVVVSGLVMLAIGDGASIAGASLLAVLSTWFVIAGRHSDAAVAESGDPFNLLPAAELSLDHVNARPGNILVPVRNPHSLAHVEAALHSPSDRDVVVMTVRLLDGSDELVSDTSPTPFERQLLSAVVALAERYRRPVRLVIVPAPDVGDAIVTTVLRLRSSDVFAGESASLSAGDQARLLGEAWERAEKREPHDVRLVIYHRSGRTDSYHLGAHPPALSSSDLDLIHRVWLDAIKAIGPHVHHHDVVRAALTKMEEQLTGPQRDEALAAIREVARPAEELAAVLRTRDYARLRDMMRNRHAGDVAALLTALSLEDQVVVFRVLPRKDAAAVFEYLAQESKETLLKAMAQEDVAALLNNMAPDDRTLFLEELPAEATRHLLALLTPAERTVALTLLGYPEQTVGRLMTPNYVAIREHWTIKEVLDHVRQYGQDSETLNVIYVVDDQGGLIDDIRIREFLLAPLENRASDLMDRRFVALKATDDQETAVSVFRQYDRTALPVTDTAGMLIGIVTIDDVLDVAEATATREIQRIGGSEALDEPYITIAFGRMIQKRAGWLTALFLGEMLTATAMGAFEAEISRAVVLALFVPLIISSGGNSGSQAATLVIRALALGEVGIRDWWRVMRRELLAGLSLGAILGAIGFLRITLWSAFSTIYGPHWFLVAITVSVSLVGVVLWGTLTGSLLPFLLRRLGFDPAASSAPFVATLVDVTGLVIYFSVALVVLKGTLL